MCVCVCACAHMCVSEQLLLVTSTILSRSLLLEEAQNTFCERRNAFSRMLRGAAVPARVCHG